MSITVAQEKIKLAISSCDFVNEFTAKECSIAGEECLLITPNDITIKWNKDNLCLRSVIVKKNDYQPISVSFFKFFNNNEQSHLYPDPNNYKDWSVGSKEDGSTIIISHHKNCIIARTRGVVDAFQHDSGPELSKILYDNPLIYKQVFSDYCRTGGSQYSLIFEHLSVVNPIVIKHTKPKLVLIGSINHLTLEMDDENTLDRLALEMNVERPKKFQFNSISDILVNCEELKGMEGYVLSYNNNQNRIKLKGAEYLKLHRLKSAISSFDKILDLYLEFNRPNYDEFYNLIFTKFDFELVEIADSNIMEACKLGSVANETLDEIRIFLMTLNGLSRKDCALKIIDKFGSRKLQSFAFSLLNHKEMNSDDYKKLIYLLKNEKSA